MFDRSSWLADAMPTPVLRFDGWIAGAAFAIGTTSERAIEGCR